MIPKVIHFCWLSNDPYPKKIAQCIKSWDKHLTGYEIRLWDFNRFPRGKSKWVDLAFDSKKYAFAADYIRAYALYTEGGIYLDSDVEILKNFDDFIHLPYIFGRESDSGRIEAAVMGAKKGNPIFKEILDYYDNNPFIREDGSFDTKSMPARLNEICAKYGERVEIDHVSKFAHESDKLYVFTSDFFSPLHIVNLKLETTPNTIAIHHFAGSWTSPYNQFKKRMQRVVGPTLTTVIQAIKRVFVKS